MKANNQKIISIVILLALLALACASGSSNTGGEKQGQPAQSNSGDTQADQSSSSQVDAGQAQQPSKNARRQWASSAEATSSYTEDNWSPAQAVGAPNTLECGDEATAWASATGSGVDTLTVYYSVPVYAQQVRIYETYYPDQVTKVSLIDANNTAHLVLDKLGQDRTTNCPSPFVLEVIFETTDYLVKGVAITVDQTFLNNWNEIDAVELIGLE